MLLDLQIALVLAILSLILFYESNQSTGRYSDLTWGAGWLLFAGGFFFLLSGLVNG